MEEESEKTRPLKRMNDPKELCAEERRSQAPTHCAVPQRGVLTACRGKAADLRCWRSLWAAASLAPRAKPES